MDKGETKSLWSECANDIDKKDIHLIKSFAKPPQVAITVSIALLIIVKDQKIAEKDCWIEFKKLLAIPSEFINFLLNYNLQGKRAEHLEMVKAFLKENNLDKREDGVKVANASQAMKSIHQWILNLIEEVEKNEGLEKGIAKNELQL